MERTLLIIDGSTFVKIDVVLYVIYWPNGCNKTTSEEFVCKNGYAVSSRLHRIQYMKTTKVRELIKLIYVYVVGSQRLMPLDALQPKPWSLVVPTCTARYLYQRP